MQQQLVSPLMLWLLQPSFLLKWAPGFIVSAQFTIPSDFFLWELIKRIWGFLIAVFLMSSLFSVPGILCVVVGLGWGFLVLLVVFCWVFFTFQEEVRGKYYDSLMLGPFHSSYYFWAVFVCLQSRHSLCTAFTETVSLANRCVWS